MSVFSLLNPIIFKGTLARTWENCFGRSPEMGSRAVIWAALIEEDEKQQLLHGRYISSCRIAEESGYALSEEGRAVQRRVWVSILKNQVEIERFIHQLKQNRLKQQKLLRVWIHELVGFYSNI